MIWTRKELKTWAKEALQIIGSAFRQKGNQIAEQELYHKNKNITVPGDRDLLHFKQIHQTGQYNQPVQQAEQFFADINT